VARLADVGSAFGRGQNPIAERPEMGVDISCRIASKTTRNCESYFLSSALSLRASSSCESDIRRRRTKVRMIAMLTSIAR